MLRIIFQEPHVILDLRIRLFIFITINETH